MSGAKASCASTRSMDHILDRLPDPLVAAVFFVTAGFGLVVGVRALSRGVRRAS